MVCTHMVLGPLAYWTRARRVCVALGLVLALSLADLFMTMSHVTGPGMYEGNPIARAVMQVGSPAYLALFKIVTIGVTVGILLVARRRVTGELASWFSLGVLLWLTGRWIVYNSEAEALTAEMNYLRHARDHRWVAIGEVD